MPVPEDPGVRLTFRPLPDPGGPPVAVRVRLLLKYALRAVRLRCVKVEDAPPPGDVGETNGLA
jgi:hypothetical protein